MVMLYIEVSVKNAASEVVQGELPELGGTGGVDRFRPSRPIRFTSLQSKFAL